MPFSKTKKNHTKEYWDNHFSSYLKPLIESCSEIEAFRSVPLRQDILRQIINDLVFSHIVVADLTDSNPNVYWELGVRLSFRHGTVTIAEERSKIPFDLKSKGVLFYPKDSKIREEFEEQFKDAIKDCLSTPNRTDSIVLETITGRGPIYSIIHRQEVINKLDGLIAESEINLFIVQKAQERAYANENRRFSSLRSKYGLIITQLGISALNLLLAEHYIEEDAEFYRNARTTLTAVNTVNARLAAWTSNDDIGKWFIEDTTFPNNLLLEFKRKIIEIKKEMVSKC